MIDVEELQSMAKSLAKRVRALAATGQDQNACEPFVNGAKDAAKILDAIGKALESPFIRVPTIRGDGEDRQSPRAVAQKMSDAFGARVAANTEEKFRDAAQSVLLSGRCGAIGFSDLLGFLGSIGKSGVLWVNSPGEKFTILIHDGAVVHASSDNAPREDQLGNVLVHLGAITRQALDRFLEQHSRWSGKIGAALEKQSLVSREQLVQALEYQIQRLFDRIGSAENATFTFNEENVAAMDGMVQMDVVHLLLETARRRDESEKG